MRVLKKFLIICFLVNSFVLLISLNKLEARADFISDMTGNAGKFITEGKKSSKGMEGVTDAVTENFSGLGQLLTLIGAGVMVAVVTYMGIKYLTATPDKQAALKQQLIGVVVAGVVIFGAYGIWKAVVTILNSATS